MRDARFEWDDEKARTNRIRHRISFEEARAVFDDPDRIEIMDEDESDEERWIAIGLANDACIVVIFTERNQRTRIISARKADRHERSKYNEGN